jgi:hypothetical protein
LHNFIRQSRFELFNKTLIFCPLKNTNFLSDSSFLFRGGSDKGRFLAIYQYITLLAQLSQVFFINELTYFFEGGVKKFFFSSFTYNTRPILAMSGLEMPKHGKKVLTGNCYYPDDNQNPVFVPQ